MDRDEDNEKDDDDDDDHEEGEPMNMRKRLLKLAGHDPVSVFTFFLPVVSINPLSANPTKCSNTLKQFVGFCRRIVSVCLTILWGWRLKCFKNNLCPTSKNILKTYIIQKLVS